MWKSGPDALISCYSDRERVICGTQRSLLVNRSAVSRTRSLSSVIFPRMTVCCLPDANGERCRTYRGSRTSLGAVGRAALNFGRRGACNGRLRKTECIGKEPPMSQAPNQERRHQKSICGPACSEPFKDIKFTSKAAKGEPAEGDSSVEISATMADGIVRFVEEVRRPDRWVRIQNTMPNRSRMRARS